MHSSPSKSSENIKETEIEILNKISNLSYYIDLKDDSVILDKIKEITFLVEKRNNKLKMLEY